jgi:DNA-binding NarL/FixJ family response regulator
MIDDHPITLDGYKNILISLKDLNSNYLIDTASDCEEAYWKIHKSLEDNNHYNIIFLDISIPPSEGLKIFSGADLGLKIRVISPSSKIIILTVYNENYRIYNILKNISPEGLLIKSDVSPHELYRAFREVLLGKLFYSNTVKILIRKQFANNIVLDVIDRNILFELSKGVMTKDLTQFIPLSLAAIEKRKRHMKKILEVDGGDMLLIDKAKKLGFI